MVLNLKGMVWARYLFAGNQNQGHLAFIDFQKQRNDTTKMQIQGLPATLGGDVVLVNWTQIDLFYLLLAVALSIVWTEPLL